MKHIDDNTAQICRVCSAHLSGTENFCPSCGHQNKSVTGFEETKTFSSLMARFQNHIAVRSEAERKVVTILFADIVGSLELLRKLDPEDAQSLLNPALNVMLTAVQQHHGAVVRMLGDGIMAIFGAPAAREDHAIAACLAATQIQEQILNKFNDTGTSLSVRVGLNTGEAVVGVFGNSETWEYNAIGESVHLAARIEKAAKPGRVWASAETVAACGSSLSFQSQGLTFLKGMDSDIELFELETDRLAGKAQNRDGKRHKLKFVGRAVELERLQTISMNSQSGSGTFVSVCGDAGIGKSRLIHEFLKTDAARSCSIGFCGARPFANKSPYYGLTALLRDFFEIKETDDQIAVRQKLSNRASSLSMAVQQHVDPLLDLMNALDDDDSFLLLEPETKARRLESTLQTFIKMQSARRPVLLIIEDVHWLDHATINLLQRLYEACRSNRVLIITSWRPEFRDKLTPVTNEHVIALSSLERTDASALLDATDVSTFHNRHLAELLLDRSEGNPLFLEELARATIDDPSLFREWTAAGTFIDERAVNRLPSTIRIILASRIDTLPAGAKALLQKASVLGADGPMQLLSHVLGLGIEAFEKDFKILQDRGFLYTEQRSEAEHFVFKHALTQDVAYSGLLIELRQRTHRAVVDSIERLYHHRNAAHSESLANHSVRGAMWQQAVKYLRRAGETALDRLAFREAASFFGRALQAMEKLERSEIAVDSEIDLRLLLRNALQPLGDRSRIESVLEEAGDLARTSGDLKRRGWVQSYLTDNYWISGKYQASIRSGDEALKVARTTNDFRLQVVTRLPIGLSYHTMGNFELAIHHFSWVADSLKGQDKFDRFGLFVLPFSFAQSFITWSHAEAGAFEQGRVEGKRGLEVALEAEHPFSVGYAYQCLGFLSLRQGRVCDAIAEFRLALGDHAFADSPVGFSYVAVHLGFAQVLAGEHDVGIALLEKTVELAEQNGFMARHSMRLGYLSEAYLRAGRTADAKGLCQRAIAMSENLGERSNQAFAQRTMGRILNSEGDFAQSQIALLSSINMSEELNLLPLKINCLRDLALAECELGEPVKSGERRKLSQELQAKIGMHPW